MRGKDHFAFGLSVSAAALAFAMTKGSISFGQGMLFTSFSVIGCMLPDIDNEESYMSKILPTLGKVVRHFFEHRTVTHDIVLYVVTALVIYFTHAPMYLWGFVLGALSHLFLDSLTVAGIPLLYACNKKVRFHLLPKKMRFHSSSVSARVVTVLFTIGFALLSGYFTYNIPAVNRAVRIAVVFVRKLLEVF